MIKVEKIVSFTGHRTNKLPNSEEKLDCLRNAVYQEVLNALCDGHNTFMMGMCYGFDLLCAEVVLNIRTTEPMNLIGVVPFREQTSKWKKEDIHHYEEIWKRCDDVVVLQEKYTSDSYHKRNRYMVDSSHLVIAYSNSSGGTQYTVNYAESKGVPVINLYRRC